MTLSDCLGRIAEGHGEWLRAGEWGSISEVFLAAGLVSLILAIALAPLFQIAYARRMQRFMGMREVDDAPLRWWRPDGRPLRAAPAVGGADTASLAAAAAQRERRVRRASWLAYAVFVVAGAVLGPLQVDPSLGNMVVVTGYMALMGIGPALVNVRPQARSRLLWLPPIIVVALGYLEPGERMDQTELWSAAVVMVLVNLASVHRTLRAVVGPLLLLCVGCLLGGVLAWWTSVPLEQCWAVPRGTSGSTGVQMAMLVISVTSVVLGAWLALAALRGLERAMQRGWLSDLSLVSATGLLIVVGLLAMAAESPGLSKPMVATIVVLWLGLTLLAYALALRLQPCPALARTLLVLRVFSRDGRTERMLDELQSRWRYAGPVLEIGGPDLAKLNLDLHEFIRFLTFRQHELLTPGGISPEAFAASLDLAMDHEGRFRIDEIFCFDSSWKIMVERLMTASDVILLDLRGFDAQRGGTTHEVVRLAALSMMDRVVTVYDAKTDWAHFDATVARDGQAKAPALKVDATDHAALERCFGALVDIARPAVAASGTTPAKVAR